MNSPVQSLWVGGHLSTLERLSIQSFLDHGHSYHLYAYQQLPELPRGAVLMDANDLLSAARIFTYRDLPSYAGFANVFRYRLLALRGGWWADTDVICLRPLDHTDEHVFASEMVWGDTSGPRPVITSCVLKGPPRGSAMQLAWRTCLEKDWNALNWGEIGPRLVTQVVEACGLQRFVQPPEAFCPVPYKDWQRLIDPNPPAIPQEAYTVHFWNEMWRRADKDKEADYPPSCFYEHLKRCYPRRTSRGY
jgi:hypothetical protein